MIGLLIILVTCSSLMSCRGNIENNFNTSQYTAEKAAAQIEHDVIPAAERLPLYVPDLDGKRVGLVINHTSRVGTTHLIDTLLALDVNVTKIFAPEHGFKGEADAGEKVQDNLYKGIEVISLYGDNRKPTVAHMSGLDIIIFDIQDVGVRFYTYISTMTYVMEAAATSQVPVMVLDRPNPNGHYIDGPILLPELSSFIGMHQVPVVYGMTIGEYALMVNGEMWLEGDVQADLTVIPCSFYDHNTLYDLPVKPSPNLPNLRSILLYPSLCFFEGTHVSIGRGTNQQFQVVGHPSIVSEFAFKPLSGPGSKYPKHQGKMCYGEDLTQLDPRWIKSQNQLQLDWLVKFHQELNSHGEDFFLDNNFFDKLAGTPLLKQQIKQGLSAAEIRQSWQSGLKDFQLIRKKYLLYEDY